MTPPRSNLTGQGAPGGPAEIRPDPRVHRSFARCDHAVQIVGVGHGRILTEPKNSLVKQYRKLFQLDGVELTFDPQALGGHRRIGDRAGTRAPAVCAILEDILMPVMFDLPSVTMSLRVLVTADSVTKAERPRGLYARDDRSGATSSQVRVTHEHLL